MRFAFFNNQGGQLRLAFYAACARELKLLNTSIEPVMILWKSEEIPLLEQFGLANVKVYDFEAWQRQQPTVKDEDVACLNKKYPNTNWGEVIAAERSFSDYSMLLGAAGDRRESNDYVCTLVVNIVHFIEHVFEKENVEVMACPTADTLFTMIGFKVARNMGVIAIAEAAAWLYEDGMNGAGFLTGDEFTHCPRMEHSYHALTKRSLDENERVIAARMANGIKGFTGKTPFHSKTKGTKAGYTAISPNIQNLLGYLLENRRRDKNVDYTRFEFFEKLAANLRRSFRKFVTRNIMGTTNVSEVPSRSVFLALQYQPEQSTLAQGIWYVNQVALVENVSKSLPLGYTLVVKEHPWGRGNRPRWQYQHMARLHNVMLCDAPAKEIIRKADAVVAISGTVGIESLVLDKPTVLLGQAFFDYSSLFYKVGSVNELPNVLRKILVDGQYERIPDRPEHIDRFLLAYRSALIPAFPVTENARIYAQAFLSEIEFRRSIQEAPGLDHGIVV